MGNTSFVNMGTESGHRKEVSICLGMVPMEDKIQFIGNYLNEILNFLELCECYGISRKNWIHMG